MRLTPSNTMMRAGDFSSLWWGLTAYLAAILGTLLLGYELARPWAVLLLLGTAVLAVIVWGRQEWTPVFPSCPITRIPGFSRSSFFYLLGVVSAFLVALTGDACYLAVPNETFGIAGILWLASIGLLLCATFVWSQSAHDHPNELHIPRWTTCEIVIFAGLILAALLIRIW